MKKSKYDVVVIGAGSGGLNVASFFARIKMKVLLIDKYEEAIGGDCLNTGCIPSKSLIHAASKIRAASLAQDYGLQLSGHVDLKKVMDEIRKKQGIIRVHDNSEALRKKGMDVILGEAKFLSPTSLSINDEEVSFVKCVLATGSHARSLDVKHDASVPMFNNETIFDTDVLPEHFVFIGGGPIGCELGQAFGRLGSKITILNTQERILPREIRETSALLTGTLELEGVTIINNASIVAIKDRQVSYTVAGADEEKTLPADAIFVGIGRVLNVEGLDVGKAGIKLDDTKTKCIINEYLETTNPAISVVGDVAGSFMFTHAAEEHAKVVINNLVSPLKKKMPTTMPWVTFTDPQVATFGKNEDDLKNEGTEYEALTTTFEDEDRAITDGVQEGFVRVYIDKKGRLLGGTMVGDEAGELVQELLLLHQRGLPLSVLYQKTYPYPTKSRINRKLASQYLARKLSTTNSTILRILFRIKSLI
jgi:pyruvate/2-oxoglutarate dehydrogenase complex dihydrolipoamide dehydrogenase (E3) component